MEVSFIFPGQVASNDFYLKLLQRRLWSLTSGHSFFNIVQKETVDREGLSYEINLGYLF